MLDLAIRGGTVVDGTGRPRVVADVGIRDGVVVAIGELDEDARRDIDAEGLVVAPGFVDCHTHYDAQITWDPCATPSPLHGVTTVLAGNCGFTLAPIDEAAASYLVPMLARVEGIPLEALEAGLDLRWRSFADYLDGLEGAVVPNIGLLVGHSTLRRMAMGERSHGPAQPGDVERMAGLLEQSLGAGALGLSSSWAETHNDPAGEPVPSRAASVEELEALSAVLAGHPGTFLEFIPTTTPVFPDERIAVMTRMSLAARRPLNWNLLTVNDEMAPGALESRLGASDAAAAAGARVLALALPQPMELRVSLASGFLFDSSLEWAELLASGTDKVLAALDDAVERRRLLHAVANAPGRWWRFERLVVDQVFHEGGRAHVGRTLGEVAAELRQDPADVFCDLSVADRLQTCFVVPSGADAPDTWRRHAALWGDPRVVVGGSDAGAHLDTLTTAGFFTDFVGPTVRDRRLIELEAAVHQITGAVAQRFGLVGRGVLRPGACADVVVFDPETIASGPVELLRDLPGGAARLHRTALGIAHVLVNGEPVVNSGIMSGGQPGTVLRSGRDTVTVGLD